MEELELKGDSKKIKSFLKKYQIVLLIIIPLFFAIFFRAYTYDLPMGDKMAEDSIEKNIKNQIQAEILTQTSNIDQNTLNVLVSQRYQSFIKENREAIKQQKEQLSNQVKQYYKDNSGQTYLLAIDPYYYYRQTQNILNNGHVGDELRNGKPFDTHMYAPKGKSIENSFHPFVAAFLHKISSIFGNNSLMKTMFILPLLFAALSVIPIFFITRKVAGNIGGLVAAFVLAIHPSFIGRTPAGFADTDAYGIFFPLVIIWIFLEAFTAKTQKNRFIISGLAGLLTGLFAFAWGSWWYIFDIIISSMGIYFIYLLIKYHKNIFKKLKTKNLIKIGLSYTISSALFISIFKDGFIGFIKAFSAPLSVLVMKQAAKPTLWPNVYTTVAELNKISFQNVISNLGGKLFFILAIIGVLLVFLKRKKIQLEIKYGILFVIWFIVTLYSTKNIGIRSVMFIIPVFAIGLGIFFGKAYNIISKWASKELDINKTLVSIGLIILIVFSFIPLTKEAHKTAQREVPSMNDAWYDSLTKIKQETSENAIVNSWWDFGHWFKAIADRKVTFDGASQNNPQAHWIGKVLLTDNEDTAIAILRMLDCGANDAYDLILEETKDPLLTKKIIDQIILEDKNNAKNTLLSNGILNSDKVLERTHCDPPEDYFITSQDMVMKGAVWAHFGSWDFGRAFAYNTVKSNPKEKSIEILKERLDYSEEEAESTYRQLKGIDESEANRWISPYPSYSSIGGCKTQDNAIVCSNGIIIDENGKKATIQVDQGQALINYRDDKSLHLTEGATEGIAAAYIPRNSQVILMDPKLIESMFTELFFYEGKNLNRFELFHHETGIDGFNIYIWKVKW